MIELSRDTKHHELSSGHRVTESSSSNNNQDSNVTTSGFKTKITKKVCI